MARHMDWNKGMQVLLLGAVMGITLNPSAFKKWAAGIKTETTRKPMLDFATGLDSALEYTGTGVLANALHSRFHSFAQDYRFTIFQAPEKPTPLARAPAGTTVPGPGPAPVLVLAPALVPQQTFSRALFLGDSLLKTILESRIRTVFQKEFKEVTIDSFAKISTGLTRPNIFDWRAKVAEFSTQGPFQAVFIFLGTNDNQSLYEEDKSYAFMSQKWKSLYVQRVHALLESTCGFATSVYWVAVPPVRDADLNGQLSQLNELVDEFIGKNKSCAHFLPSAPALAGAQGEFTSYLKIQEKTLKVRERDGIHLTWDGATVFATYLARFLKKEYP